MNHCKNFVDPDSGAHTNTIEGVWALIKKKLKWMCGTMYAFWETSEECHFLIQGFQMHFLKICSTDRFCVALHDLQTQVYSQGARPNKKRFRSTHPTEKVWQLILIDQYLLFKIRYYVVPNCGTPDEINGALYHDMALSIETRLKKKLTSNFIFFR